MKDSRGPSLIPPFRGQIGSSVPLFKKTSFDPGHGGLKIPQHLADPYFPHLGEEMVCVHDGEAIVCLQPVDQVKIGVFDVL